MSFGPFYKLPSAIRDYEVIWSTWLAGRTITTSSWTVPSGLTNVSESNTTTAALVRLSGGVWGTRYLVTNTIVASDGESNSGTIAVNVFSPYCTPSEVRAVGTQITATSSPTPATNAVLDTIIERASRMFDLACGVEPGYFGAADPAGVAASRTFYGRNSNYLKLDPYVPGSLNATITYPTGYTVPEFIERDGYLVFTSEDVVPPFYYSTGWLSGVPLTVSARWGFQDTPEDVKAAVIELAINLWRETDPAGVKLVNIEGQVLREGLPPRVKDIVRRRQIKGAVFV